MSSSSERCGRGQKRRHEEDNANRDCGDESRVNGEDSKRQKKVAGSVAPLLSFPVTLSSSSKFKHREGGNLQSESNSKRGDDTGLPRGHDRHRLHQISDENKVQAKSSHIEKPHTGNSMKAKTQPSVTCASLAELHLDFHNILGDSAYIEFICSRREAPNPQYQNETPTQDSDKMKSRKRARAWECKEELTTIENLFRALIDAAAMELVPSADQNNGKAHSFGELRPMSCGKRPSETPSSVKEFAMMTMSIWDSKTTKMRPKEHSHDDIPDILRNIVTALRLAAHHVMSYWRRQRCRLLLEQQATEVSDNAPSAQTDPDDHSCPTRKKAAEALRRALMVIVYISRFFKPGFGGTLSQAESLVLDLVPLLTQFECPPLGEKHSSSLLRILLSMGTSVMKRRRKKSDSAQKDTSKPNVQMPTLDIVRDGLMELFVRQILRQLGWDRERVLGEVVSIKGAESFLSTCLSDIPTKECQRANETVLVHRRKQINFMRSVPNDGDDASWDAEPCQNASRSSHIIDPPHNTAIAGSADPLGLLRIDGCIYLSSIASKIMASKFASKPPPPPAQPCTNKREPSFRAINSMHDNNGKGPCINNAKSLPKFDKKMISVSSSMSTAFPNAQENSTSSHTTAHAHVIAIEKANELHHQRMNLCFTAYFLFHMLIEHVAEPISLTREKISSAVLACFLLAGKIEECPVKLKTLVGMVRKIPLPPPPSLVSPSPFSFNVKLNQRRAEHALPSIQKLDGEMGAAAAASMTLERILDRTSKACATEGAALPDSGNASTWGAPCTDFIRRCELHLLSVIGFGITETQSLHPTTHVEELRKILSLPESEVACVRQVLQDACYTHSALCLLQDPWLVVVAAYYLCFTKRSMSPKPDWEKALGEDVAVVKIVAEHMWAVRDSVKTRKSQWRTLRQWRDQGLASSKMTNLRYANGRTCGILAKGGQFPGRLKPPEPDLLSLPSPLSDVVQLINSQIDESPESETSDFTPTHSDSSSFYNLFVEKSHDATTNSTSENISTKDDVPVPHPVPDVPQEVAPRHDKIILDKNRELNDPPLCKEQRADLSKNSMKNPIVLDCQSSTDVTKPRKNDNQNETSAPYLSGAGQREADDPKTPTKQNRTTDGCDVFGRNTINKDSSGNACGFSNEYDRETKPKRFLVEFISLDCDNVGPNNKVDATNNSSTVDLSVQTGKVPKEFSSTSRKFFADSNNRPDDQSTYHNMVESNEHNDQTVEWSVHSSTFVEEKEKSGKAACDKESGTVVIVPSSDNSTFCSEDRCKHENIDTTPSIQLSADSLREALDNPLSSDGVINTTVSLNSPAEHQNFTIESSSQSPRIPSHQHDEKDASPLASHDLKLTFCHGSHVEEYSTRRKVSMASRSVGALGTKIDFETSKNSGKEDANIVIDDDEASSRENLKLPNHLISSCEKNGVARGDQEADSHPSEKHLGRAVSGNPVIPQSIEVSTNTNQHIGVSGEIFPKSSAHGGMKHSKALCLSSACGDGSSFKATVSPEQSAKPNTEFCSASGGNSFGSFEKNELLGASVLVQKSDPTPFAATKNTKISKNVSLVEEPPKDDIFVSLLKEPTSKGALNSTRKNSANSIRASRKGSPRPNPTATTFKASNKCLQTHDKATQEGRHVFANIERHLNSIRQTSCPVKTGTSLEPCKWPDKNTLAVSKISVQSDKCKTTFLDVHEVGQQTHKKTTSETDHCGCGNLESSKSSISSPPTSRSGRRSEVRCGISATKGFLGAISAIGQQKKEALQKKSPGSNPNAQPLNIGTRCHDKWAVRSILVEKSAQIGSRMKTHGNEDRNKATLQPVVLRKEKILEKAGGGKDNAEGAVRSFEPPRYKLHQSNQTLEKMGSRKGANKRKSNHVKDIDNSTLWQRQRISKENDVDMITSKVTFTFDTDSLLQSLHDRSARANSKGKCKRAKQRQRKSRRG